MDPLLLKKQRNPEFVNYIKNYQEALSLFSEPDIFNSTPESYELRKRLIFAYDSPSRRHRLACLPDLVMPKNYTLFFLPLLPELLSRGHDINEISSRGSLLHILKTIQVPREDFETIKHWKEKVSSLGGVSSFIR